MCVAMLTTDMYENTTKKIQNPTNISSVSKLVYLTKDRPFQIWRKKNDKWIGLTRKKNYLTDCQGNRNKANHQVYIYLYICTPKLRRFIHSVQQQYNRNPIEGCHSKQSEQGGVWENRKLVPPYLLAQHVLYNCKDRHAYVYIHVHKHFHTSHSRKTGGWVSTLRWVVRRLHRL